MTEDVGRRYQSSLPLKVWDSLPLKEWDIERCKMWDTMNKVLAALPKLLWIGSRDIRWVIGSLKLESHKIMLSVINWWMPKHFLSETLIKFVTAVNRFDNLFINCISQCISQCISELHRSTVLLNKHWSKWSRCKLASAVNGLDNDALSGRLGAWSFFLKVHSFQGSG